MTTIRAATSKDAFVLSQLYTQLGYDYDVDDLQKRLYQITPTHPTQAFVILQNHQVVGVIELHIKHNLYRPEPVCTINAIVVDENHRRQGIGKQLLAFAALHAKDQGCAFIELSSNRCREDAHKFYESLGFTEKTHRYFRKEVS